MSYVEQPDFSKVYLLAPEKRRLFVMRIKRKVTERFLGQYRKNLLRLQFIAPNHSDTPDAAGYRPSDGTYSITETYRRYLVYQKEQFWRGKVGSAVVNAVISGIVSLAVSLAVAYFTGAGIPA